TMPPTTPLAPDITSHSLLDSLQLSPPATATTSRSRRRRRSRRSPRAPPGPRTGRRITRTAPPRVRPVPHRCGTGLTRGGAVLVMRRPVRGPGGALGLRRLLRLLRDRDVVAVAGGDS